MHVEIQVALSFFISYMYNKLPRRRVNIFGEELERALKKKFQDHWYPEKPMKGSAYRCLKTGDPIDPILEDAARKAGMEVSEIKDNLPIDLAVWIDPGEVSYRIGEKGQIKVLFSETSDSVAHEESLDKEVTKTFNPEAQCFKPIENLSTSLSNVSISPKSNSPFTASSPTPSYKGREGSPVGAFAAAKSTIPLTFTTASFAQTKFGSTKLKSSAKRTNRMSPTEFSNYIKQRQLVQQQQPMAIGGFTSQFPSSRPRSLSPNLPLDQNLYFSANSNNGGSLYTPWGRNVFDQSFAPSTSFFSDLPSNNAAPVTKFPLYEPVNGGLIGASGTNGPSVGNVEKSSSGISDTVMGLYPSSQYQHLLVAN